MSLNIPAHPYDDEPFLVQECKKGVAKAQRAMYNKYCDTLMLICLRYTRNEEDAREMLVDTFMSAFRGIGGFTWSGTGSLPAWLKKIAVNQCLMQLRRHKLPLQELPASAEENLAGQEHILSAIGNKELLLLIRQLPPGYRAVFNLYVFEEMSHKEIAALLGISEQTSKSQLHRARALLQQQVIQREKTGL
jgi:RNA polymerase sigma factor (sigma-70 family)